MKFAHERDAASRTEDQLRLQPLSLLATIPVILVFTAVITYACVFSETIGEIAIRALLASVVVFPMVIWFARVVRKEEQTQYSAASRRVAWRVMLYGYLTVIAAMLFLFFTADRQGIARYHLITCILMSLPIAQALFTLNRSSKKHG